MLDKNTLFALSLFPYLGFLWFLTRTPATPRLALTGFYALLVFVAVTIPAGIYAKVGLGEELANVDWLHGGAEAFLTLSNIFVVLGFRQAVVQYQAQHQSQGSTETIALAESPNGEP
jgi:heme A synthase